MFAALAAVILLGSHFTGRRTDATSIPGAMERVRSKLSNPRTAVFRYVERHANPRGGSPVVCGYVDKQRFIVIASTALLEDVEGQAAMNADWNDLCSGPWA